MHRWRILVVDDDRDIAEQTAESLRMVAVSAAEETADVEFETDFDAALARLAEERFDLLVLDVRDQSRTGESQGPSAETGSEITDADVGLTIFANVRAHSFVPIIFFTALPNLVLGEDIAGAPFVAVVSKSAENVTEELRDQVQAVFDSTLPAIHRALRDHVDQVVRDFMVGFVEEHWTDLTSPPRKGDLAHLLLRRLALSLADGGGVLGGRLADESVELAPDCVHPMRYYIVPPVGSWTTGDLITGPRIGSSSDTCWYVMITPACDLVEAHRKADYVVLVECVSLDTCREFTRFRETRPATGDKESRAGRDAEAQLRRLMQNNAASGQKERTMYLPAAWEVPDLLVDFQRLGSVAYDDLVTYRRVATLDSPYAESIVEKFGRYLGRLGTPDLDVEVPMTRLRQP
ncbi:MAG: hypothetical protein M3256_14275 [Actinomycetota bacterium]|nr:hypothetical protein [Actinomycetota bacterium]